RARHGRDVRAGGTHHCAERRPRAGRRHAAGDPEQPGRAGRLSGRRGAGMSLLEVEGLNSYYGDSHILFDVALRVEAHEVVALLGRNGAGKTTTLKSLMGVLAPRSGSISFDGM